MIDISTATEDFRPSGFDCYLKIRRGTGELIVVASSANRLGEDLELCCARRRLLACCADCRSPVRLARGRAVVGWLHAFYPVVTVILAPLGAFRHATSAADDVWQPKNHT